MNQPIVKPASSTQGMHETSLTDNGLTGRYHALLASRPPRNQTRHATPVRGGGNAAAVCNLGEMTSTALAGASKKAVLTLSLILCTLATGYSQCGRIIKFDPPGSSTAANLGTFPFAINDREQVVGYFLDQKILHHSFVRDRGGEITIIDPPGAGTKPGQGSFAVAINIEGVIVGAVQDVDYAFHAFLRDRSGHFSIFDAPGAGTGTNKGTQFLSINCEGAISGQVADDKGVVRSFIRSPGGALTLFDAPDAGTGPDEGTFAENGAGLNPLGMATGYSVNSSGNYEGYLRERNGSIKSFRAPGASGTLAFSIDPAGTIVGVATFANGAFKGFIRSFGGAFTLFNVPGAVNASAVWICPFGVITGYWDDPNVVYHGFVRYPDGVVTKFDVPGAGAVRGSSQGTLPVAINAWGEIVGQIQDSTNAYHGFIRIP